MEELSWLRYLTGIFFLLWYLVILIVAYTGFCEILLKFRSRKVLAPPIDLQTNKYLSRSKTKSKIVEEAEAQAEEAEAEEDGKDINSNDTDLLTCEGVTIIRPIKGIDPELGSCLESSFVQNYPSSKLQILFCVDNPNDPSLPIIRKLIRRYPTIDAEILVSENYNAQAQVSQDHFGPNPKVNNLAKGFLKAKYDILWVMDSNVWASSNILKNSVITLNSNLNNGRKVGDQRPVKLVHHVPLAVCTDSNTEESGDFLALDELENRVTPTASDEECETPQNVSYLTNRKPTPPPSSPSLAPPSSSSSKPSKFYSRAKKLGAKLDEMFLHTSHSKFYVSLNNLSIAPCVNGKSNIYRKSDLDQSVKLIPYKDSEFFRDPKVKRDAYEYTSSAISGNSIKFFARYIGEDNMIGIALWENCNGRTGLTGDIVVQPLNPENNSIRDYIQRRVRWLRVRKYMVLLATLIEPTTESLVCGVYGTYAVSTLFLHQWFSIKWFMMHMIIWLLTDYVQYNVLMSHVKDSSNNNIAYLPQWMNRVGVAKLARGFASWLYVWCLREMLALPIWAIAMIGHEIDWRGAPFRIKKDLTAEEL